jgi:hypothetical protein
LSSRKRIRSFGHCGSTPASCESYANWSVVLTEVETVTRKELKAYV